MTDVQAKIIAELQAAAAARYAEPIRVSSNDRGVTVQRAADNTVASPAQTDTTDDLLEEYVWNSAGNMLIRVGYIVWEHIVGEDHEWGRFSTERAAERRIAALFSPTSLGNGDYYITRLYTIRPLD